jgi:hypothetical protein
MPARMIGSWRRWMPTFTVVSPFPEPQNPSVIRIRIEGLRAAALASLLADVMAACTEDLLRGATISVTEKSIRVRRLPLLR